MLLDKILKININSKLEERINYEDGESLKNFYEFKTRDYCPYCKNKNTFYHKNIWVNADIVENKPFYSKISYNKTLDHFVRKGDDICLFYEAKCSLDLKHIIYYAFTINEEGEIFKFSEYPFYLIKEKISNPNEKLLTKLNLNNFMYSSYISSLNNLHIASFLYIRRVLEGLVKKIALDNKIDISNEKMLGKKVELIKTHLPSFIKENVKKFSQILGDTIHNLTEEEASKNYQFILKIINAFIHEIEAKIKKEKDKKEIRSALQEYEKS